MEAVKAAQKISEETLKEIAKFFLKTSVPRIIAEERKKVKTN
ncbi:hypothetical protein [Virgibacillus ndiopensis]|nr:hypothetical protein [Virgibacillus ndiopensis]